MSAPGVQQPIEIAVREGRRTYLVDLEGRIVRGQRARRRCPGQMTWAVIWCERTLGAPGPTIRRLLAEAERVRRNA